MITMSPSLAPSSSSTRSPMRRPVRTRCSCALPSFMTRIFSTPANTTIAADGTTSAGRRARDDVRLGEGAGPQGPVAIGHFGFDGQRARAFGDRRAEPRDAALVACRFRLRPSRARPGPTRTAPATRSGTESCRRSGCCRTTVRTGVPAARYSPANASRSRITPSIGERSTVSSSCCRAMRQLGAALRQHAPAGCGPPPSRLRGGCRRSRVARRRFRGRPARRCRARRRWQCVPAGAVPRSSVAWAWRTSEVRVTSIVSSSPVGSSPRRARACCRAASDWRRRSSKSVGVSRASTWPLRDRGAEVDQQLIEAPGHLQAERDLFFGRQRAADRHGAFHGLVGQADDFDRLGRREPPPGGRLPTIRRRRPTRSRQVQPKEAE